MKSRRKNMHIGDSRAITLPAQLSIGEESSMACNRLILVDPRGEISEDDLLRFMEKHIEPSLWPWLKKLNEENSKNE